jgi:NSS family neurotransmitter:Na+ symporter
MSEQREQWGSKFGFLMAAAGSAVGLGNVWRFPYITGKYGGAAFVFTYLIVVFVIGLSVMIAEMTIGRNAKLDAVGSFRKLGGSKWAIVGWMGFFCGFVIFSYYAVITGWTIAYIYKSFTGLMAQAAAGQAKEAFGSFVSDPVAVIGYTIVVMIITAGIVYKGVTNGIEKSCKILMPTLFLILVILVARAVTLPGAGKGIEFYMKPDFTKLTSEAILSAIGQGFYSLSLAMGIMVVYGSYISKEEYIPTAARSIVIIDTAVAVLAGFIIFPSAFAFGIQPDAGPSLTFVTLPGVFTKMPAGALFSAAFFLLLFIAALTSCISLFEVTVAYGIDQLHLSRKKSTLFMVIAITLVGIPSALSLGGRFPKIFGMDCLDFMDYITNNIIMPIGGILICLFVGWFWTKPAHDELTDNGKVAFPMYTAWLWICRVFAPLAIFSILAWSLYTKYFAG